MPTQRSPPQGMFGSAGEPRSRFPDQDGFARGRGLFDPPETGRRPRSFRSPSRSRSRSRSISPRDRSRRRSLSRSPSPRRRRSLADELEEKPWFRKKTLWTTMATIATVAALVPATMSARAAKDAANASTRASYATTRAAHAAERSATAVEATTIANGHMNHKRQYTGPAHHLGLEPREMKRLQGGRQSRSKRIEYPSPRSGSSRW
jgi:hypothetical protein